jgi:NACHT domain
MKGTRQPILKRITKWVTSPQGGNGVPPQGNTYWFYSSPGIGKTSLAHSICANLYNQKRLTGAFFCKKDDPNLRELRNILPSLIDGLARLFPLFQSLVAECLRNDRNLTLMSMKYTLLLDFISKLPRHPKHALVFLIDALDECGNDKSRPALLEALTKAAAEAPWLKIVITSRPEADIKCFFDAPHTSLHLQYDLAADKNASSNLRIFAKERFCWVASKQYLPTSWPEQLLFNRVTSRAAGLFIFIETIALDLERCNDPTEFLRAILQDVASTGVTPLYELYSNILQARIVLLYNCILQ